MLSLQYKLKKMMIMKKMFSMLIAVVAMAMAFVSCENPEDPTVYCWEVSYSVELFGITLSDTMDIPMTTAEKQELEREGNINYDGMSMKIISIKKQSLDECEGANIDLD